MLCLREYKAPTVTLRLPEAAGHLGSSSSYCVGAGRVNLALVEAVKERGLEKATFLF